MPSAAVVHPWSMTAPPLPQQRQAPLVPAQPLARAKPLTVDERAAEARAKRIASETAPPPLADESRWSDPQDKVNTRSPIQVRGYRRGDVLGNMHRRGTDVTEDHVTAANIFRVSWDIAHHGLSAADFMAGGGGSGSASPRTGPGANATERAAREREVARVLRVLGSDAVPLLLWVVIDNRDIAAWCAALQAKVPDLRIDPKKEMGKLLFILSRLAEHYGVDSRRDRLRKARAEMMAK